MKEIILLLSLFLVSVPQYGCIIFSGPTNNSGFKNIEKLSDVEGVYKNRGEEGTPSAYGVYLSSMIWPNLGNSDRATYHRAHESIELIEIRLIDKNTLIVRGMGQGKIIHESTFVEGSDFVLDSGYITLRYGVGFALDGSPFIGLSYEKRTLGLDTDGNGKYRSSGAVAGTAFLIMPMIGAGRVDIRFVKIAD